MAIKYSRQREAIWDYLKDRKDHPTADDIYIAVRKDFPNISLGTVYRNIMLMKNMGRIRTVDVGDGIIHFDPNTSEHDHFIC
ncbi:MAG: transcriptional repressor, partial [Lachnospiraceae bacterium]|nr:transcriptional repressor [Lachnospiraceae bacterium]